MATRIHVVTQIDDGRGRFLQDRKEPAVIMTRKEDWHDVSAAGDYAFSEFAGFEFLVVVCPFCGFEAPLPWLIKVVSTEPLTIDQELFCKKCDTFFHVIEGSAYKSWAQLKYEELKKHLKES